MRRLTTLQPRVALMERRQIGTAAHTVRIRGTTLQATRDRILARDKGVCQCSRCKQQGMLRLATIVDHIVPLWAGGAEDDSNRQAINADCHALKSADEARMRATGAWRG